jgi:hypothetical protein
MFFGNDITWTPTGDGQAILIQASDVTLDMQHFKLQSTITAFNTTGILATAVENLVIKNGTIEDMGTVWSSNVNSLQIFCYKM